MGPIGTPNWYLFLQFGRKSIINKLILNTNQNQVPNRAISNHTVSAGTVRQKWIWIFQIFEFCANAPVRDMRFSAEIDAPFGVSIGPVLFRMKRTPLQSKNR